MTLSTDAKDFIASELGRNNCFASSGIAYIDPRGVSGTGSTYNVVKTMKLGGKGPHGEWFDDIPDYRQITDPDITWIGNNSYCVGDGGGGCVEGSRWCEGNNAIVCVGGVGKGEYCQYGCEDGRCKASGGISGCTPGTTRCNRGNIETCNSSREWAVSTYCGGDGCRTVGGVPECIPAGGGGTPGSQDTTGPFEVWVGESSGTGCSPGDPSVTLDTSDAYAYYKSDPTSYVGVMDIMVRNNNNEDCYAYFAWEMRMWPGSGYTTCPATTPEVVEISRFLATVSATRDITLKKILANETEMVSGSFAIPAGVEGQKTICLTLWGNYSYSELVAELAAEGYSKEIPW